MEWWQWLVYGTSALVAARFAWFAVRDFRRGEEMREVGEHVSVAIGVPAMTLLVSLNPVLAIILAGTNLALSVAPERVLDKTLESGERRSDKQLHD